MADPPGEATRTTALRVFVELGISSEASVPCRIVELGRAHAFHPTLIDWAHQIRLVLSAAVQGRGGWPRQVHARRCAGVVAFRDEVLRFTYEVPEGQGG